MIQETNCLGTATAPSGEDLRFLERGYRCIEKVEGGGIRFADFISFFFYIPKSLKLQTAIVFELY